LRVSGRFPRRDDGRLHWSQARILKAALALKKDAKHSVRQICEIVGVSRNTYYKYMENPHKGFRGNISGAWGGTTNYGVYAEPIAAVLRADGFNHSYVFYGGVGTLRAEIAAGHPVVTWISGTWGGSSRSTKVDAAGDTYSLIPYEHTITAYGYDDTGVWVMDPGLAEKYHVSWGKFMSGWNRINGMALVVAP